jgi:hypothetical protein
MDLAINHLLSLQAVREKAHIVFDLAKQGLLNHFDYHPDRLDAVVEFVVGIIQVRYDTSTPLSSSPSNKEIYIILKNISSATSAPKTSTASPHTAAGNTSTSETPHE